jgi:hypothetical protein
MFPAGPNDVEFLISKFYEMSKSIWPLVLDNWRMPTYSMHDFEDGISGFALFDYNHILFDSYLSEINKEEFFETVGHEMAHLIAFALYGEKAVKREHGTEWKKVMIQLGLDPQKTSHTYDVSHLPVHLLTARRA